jgi:PAS domain S-box-containing protein
MMRWLLTPPVLTDDPNSHIARQLYAILITVICAATVMVGFQIVNWPALVRVWLQFILVVYVVSLVCLVLVQLGRTRLASLAVVAGAWAVVTAYAAMAGGLQSRVAWAYFIPVLGAGMVLGVRAGFVAAGVCSLTGLGLSYAVTVGALPAAGGPARPLDYWLANTGYLAIAAGLQYLASHSMGEAWDEARRELAERREAETALRASETTLKTFINAIPQPAFLLDRAGRFLMANVLLEKTTGKNLPQIIGQDAFGLLKPPLAAQRKARFDQVIQRGAPVQFEDDNAGDRFINYMVPVLDGAGQVTSVAVFALNITERRRAEVVMQAQFEQLEAQHEQLVAQDQALQQAEADLRQLNAELEQRVTVRTAALRAANVQLAAVNQEVEAFSHSVSHDLRAPLRRIQNYGQIMLDECGALLTEGGRHYLDRILANVNDMNKLIEDLLGLARVSRLDLQLAPVDMSAIATAILEELRAAEPARRVDFVCAPGLVAETDARLMRTVLQNLLGNAWKFTSKHPTARIELGCSGQPGQTVYFIRDDGAGFEPGAAHKLFAAFQRLHTAEEFDGTGVGLATVQRLLHRHGGRIWAEGAVEQGATFYFTLDSPQPAA